MGFRLLGFKNGTDGGLDVAVNAMKSVCNPIASWVSTVRARSPFSKPGATVTTRRTAWWTWRPNYDMCTLRCASRRWRKPPCPRTSWWTVATPTPTSSLSYSPIAENVANQIIEGNQSIIGLMLESNSSYGQPEDSQNSRTLNMAFQ